MIASGYYGNSLLTAAYCQYRCTSTALMDSQHGNKIPAVLQLAALVCMDWSKDGIWSLISVDPHGSLETGIDWTETRDHDAFSWLATILYTLRIVHE